jgi:FkbH-like protein
MKTSNVIPGATQDLENLPKIEIVATFTADLLKLPLERVLLMAGLPAEVRLGGYNQVFQELIRPDSTLAKNRNGVNILLLRVEDWAGREQHELSSLPPAGVERQQIERNVTDFLAALKKAAGASPAPHLVCLCPASPALESEAGARDFLQGIEAQLKEGVEQLPNGFFLPSSFILETYPVNRFDDPHSNRLGHVPYTREFFAALSLALARRIYRFRTNPCKVIVLDLDNTLWTGVAGEDGPLGIKIDDSRRFLQKFMLDQQRSGAILCICSKNNQEDAWAVFEQRSDMELKREHFAGHRINWNNKSANIKSLAAELNLGLDSMVFIDDDAAVCAEVRHNCPEVSVIHLPSDPAGIPPLIRHLWLFDRLKVTKEDQRRTELYRQNKAREEVRDTARDFGEFLSSLALEISIAPMESPQLARVSQLTFRTNQFNCTTVRRSEAEIRDLLDKKELFCYVTDVKDRFGDYGLVGVTLHGISGESLFVDTFLMSCRVLGRGVEHRMISNLGTLACARNLRWVDLRFVRSAKNRPALDFLESLPDVQRLEQDGVTVFRLAAEGARSLDCRSFESADAVKAPDEREQLSSQPSSLAVPLESLLQIATECREPAKLLASSRAAGAVVSSSDPPVTQTEIRLAQIWERMLGVTGIGIHDNYFDLGGDSLQAVGLFAEIEQQFQRDLNLATLFDAPTIGRLAAVIDSQAADDWSCIVPIQPQGSKPAFYCMHAAGGNVLFYKDLARHLGADQPFFGLQAQGISKKKPWHRRVEDMAECYLQEIRAVQPKGPYFLGGSSFGGLIAYEMARQLQNAGETVGILAMFDTYGPNYPRFPEEAGRIRKGVYRLASRAETHWHNLLLLDWKNRGAYVVDRMKRAKRMLSRKWNKRRNEIAAQYHSAMGRPIPAHLMQTQNAILEALSAYKYPP